MPNDVLLSLIDFLDNLHAMLEPVFTSFHNYEMVHLDVVRSDGIG